ncbi:uncharacterized protein LOC123421803 isoform X1 [Hordeum vulgare subsp. vulgare]|uniref:uncharacterized protein LOC123421803 isoform X1 n=1 Tax=Hordeum vulgare subsp. vulgare TaxID=112509 RepID=UPI001D1A55E6|nr:uncharacterized protein LOC123421803 isoform X1 [Hordeum vulgare subsp. vulgare]
MASTFSVADERDKYFNAQSTGSTNKSQDGEENTVPTFIKDFIQQKQKLLDDFERTFLLPTNSSDAIACLEKCTIDIKCVATLVLKGSVKHVKEQYEVKLTPRETSNLKKLPITPPSKDQTMTVVDKTNDAKKEKSKGSHLPLSSTNDAKKEKRQSTTSVKPLQEHPSGSGESPGKGLQPGKKTLEATEGKHGKAPKPIEGPK